MPKALRKEPRRQSAIGQLTLVEHSLCPLDPSVSLVENLVHQADYHYSSVKRERKRARVRVFCPLGLSAGDELYLWGLLALTMAQAEPDADFRATPHWCLRQLGLIDQNTRRGGRQYKQFSAALARLSVVKYLNDGFYDPIRGEHRQVSFGLLSYSLPTDPDSSRAWQIVWDPLFFEMTRAAAGHFRFDLETYRTLDPASRRLFLFLCKVFSRRSNLARLSLDQLAVDLLGFSSSLSIRHMKVKLQKCLDRLTAIHVVGHWNIDKLAPGKYQLAIGRGSYFEHAGKLKPNHLRHDEQPLWELLERIGFEPQAALRLMRRFPARLLEEWADITLAARDRFGMSFFRRSPMAYMVDSVTKADQGTRTAPDWWVELRRKEKVEHEELSMESQNVFQRLRAELFDPEHESEAVERSTRRGFSSVGQLLRKT